MGYLPYGLTTRLEGQNQVNTQSANAWPNMPGYAGIDKLPFDAMRTPEDQIHWLYLFAKQAENLHITKKEAQELIDAACTAFKEWVEQDQQRQDDDVAEKYDYLLKLIYELVGFNGMVYDPTKGEMNAVRYVAENIYDFDRVFSVTAADFDKRYAWTAGKYDGEGIVARDYDVAFVAYNFLDKLGYETQTATSNWFMQRLRATMGDMGFLNFDTPLDNEGGTVRLMLGEDSPFAVEGLGLELKTTAPVAVRDKSVTLQYDEPLYKNADKLALQVEKPISIDGGAVSLAHDETLKVADGKLGVDAGQVIDIIAPLKVDDGETKPAASSPYSVAIGVEASTAGTYAGAVAIGYGAKTDDPSGNPIAIGQYAHAIGESSTVIGDNSNAKGTFGSSYGAMAYANGNYSVAIGYQSQASEDYEFSIGMQSARKTITRRITHVTDPTAATDAATKGYVDALKTQIETLTQTVAALKADYEAFKPTCVTEGVTPLYKES